MCHLQAVFATDIHVGSTEYSPSGTSLQESPSGRSTFSAFRFSGPQSRSNLSPSHGRGGVARDHDDDEHKDRADQLVAVENLDDDDVDDESVDEADRARGFEGRADASEVKADGALADGPQVCDGTRWVGACCG